MGRQLETELKTKAEFVETLADSFAFCDDAYASLTDANISELISAGTRPDCTGGCSQQQRRPQQ